MEKIEVFEGYSLEDLLKETVTNSRARRNLIKDLIGELKDLIDDDLGNATLIVPLIKEYLSIAVTNDEHLIKVAGIVSRVTSKNTQDTDSSLILSKEEKAELKKVLDEISEESK